MKIVKGIGSIIAFVFSIALLVIFIAMIAVLFIKKATTKEELTKFVNDAKVFEVKMGDDFNNQTLKEGIAFELQKKGIPKEQTYNLLESDELTNLIADYLYNYCNYFLKNDKKPVLEETYIKNNLKNILDKQGIYLNEDNFNYLLKQVLSVTNELNKKTIDKTEYNIYLDKISNIIYNEKLVIYFAITIVISYIVLAILTLSFYRPIGFISIDFMILSILFAIGSFVIKIVMKQLINVNGTIENIIKSFGNVISLNVLKTSFILLIIGVILFIVYVVLRKLLYKEPEEDCTLVENHIIPRFIDKVLK